MKLKNLTIAINPSWSDSPGKYTGEVEYEGNTGGVKMILSSEVSNALLICIGETITKFAADAAREVEKSLIQSVAEAKQPLLEEKTTTV